MAFKATVHKATIQIADMDRNFYGDLNVTLARHPSETDERMLVRLLVYALNFSDDGNGALELARDLWDADEPALWQKDLTGQMLHWIEVGQPDEKRLARVCARSERVSVYAYDSSAEIWWAGIRNKLTRFRNLSVWQIPSAQAEELATLSTRTMELQVTVQDGTVWVSNGERSVELSLIRLCGESEMESSAR